jgi:hypothetical protein
MAGRPQRRAKLAEMRAANPIQVDATGPDGEAINADLVYRPIPPKFDVRKTAIPFSDKLAVTIISRVAHGEALSDICAEDGFPAVGSFLRWLTYPEHGALREAYALAREACGQWHADNALRAATNATDPQLGRLRFDAYRWAASKYFPKHFGDKVQHTNAAGDGDATIAIRQENTPLIGELLALMESRRAQIAAPDSESGAAKG